MGEDITEAELLDLPGADDERPGLTVVKDWEGPAGEPIAEENKLTPEQTEELAKDLWPQDEQERMTAEEAAERLTPAEVTQATTEAELYPDDGIPTINLNDALPIGKSGDKLRLLQTGEILYWRQYDAKSGNWRTTPQAETVTEKLPDDIIPPNGTPGSKAEPWPGMSFNDFIKWVQANGKKEGWLFKTFSFDVAKAKEKPYECACEVKEMMGW